jgi:hypothetical protein
LVRRPEGWRPLETHAFGWKDNIKVDKIDSVEGLKKVVAGSG